MNASKKLYLLHGWAANGRIFDRLRRRLPPHLQVFAPNLPGHGGEPFDGRFDVAAAAEKIAENIAPGSCVLGWSLGGQVALHIAARYPEKVRGLCLTASFARLTAAPDYPEGLKRPAFDMMADGFLQDYAGYMRRFLQLQFLHAPGGREIIDDILPDVAKSGTPAALREAADAVLRGDARALLPGIGCPVLLVFGGRDAVTPPRMGVYLQRHLPDAELHILDKAAHAPFLSHEGEFAALLERFAGRL